MSNAQAAATLHRARADVTEHPQAYIASRLNVVGAATARYGIVAVIAWIGAMKFTAYEANAIEGLVANSPFMSWVYQIFSVEAFGVAVGSIELTIALLIALKPVSAKAAAVGAALATGMFATTLSFMLSTPGVFEGSLGGFPALSVMPGQFLVKDVALIGISLWLLGDALKALSTAKR